MFLVSGSSSVYTAHSCNFPQNIQFLHKGSLQVEETTSPFQVHYDTNLHFFLTSKAEY